MNADEDSCLSMKGLAHYVAQRTQLKSILCPCWVLDALTACDDALHEQLQTEIPTASLQSPRRINCFIEVVLWRNNAAKFMSEVLLKSRVNESSCGGTSSRTSFGGSGRHVRLSLRRVLLSRRRSAKKAKPLVVVVLRTRGAIRHAPIPTEDQLLQRGSGGS